MGEKIEFRHEGQTLDELHKDKAADEGSDDEKKGQANGDDAGSGDDDNGAGDSKNRKPFHEDPEVQHYIERQIKNTVEAMEAKHKNDLDALRTELAGKRDDTQSAKIPKWFGGNQDQWNEFRGFLDQSLAAREEAIFGKMSESKQQEEKLVQEATEFFQAELKEIQGDKTLNPKGLKVNPEQLLKVVMENELIDSKGRWNYRAGWRILRPELEAAAAGNKNNNQDRKTLAGASVKTDKGGEPQSKSFKTSEDFKKKRPW